MLKLEFTCSDIDCRFCVIIIIFQFFAYFKVAAMSTLIGPYRHSRLIMSGDWAEKLTSTSSAGSSSRNSPALSGSSPAKSKKPHLASTFNGKEVLQYLHDSYNTHLQEAKEDKLGEDIKVYRSLESTSQWKTKPSFSKNAGTSTSGETTKNKHSSRTVIRNQQDSSGKSNGSLDILFELNRSIYQQQHQQQSGKK